MVHFDCPNCKARIDADSAFRGGVARCDRCGALIHVPDKPSRARPERPESPGALEQDDPPPPGPKRRSLTLRLLTLAAALVAIAAAAGYLYARFA